MIRKTDDLEKIVGGTSLTGSVINALTEIIKVLGDAGRGLGSSIRRIGTNNLCPLK